MSAGAELMLGRAAPDFPKVEAARRALSTENQYFLLLSQSAHRYVSSRGN